MLTKIYISKPVPISKLGVLLFYACFSHCERFLSFRNSFHDFKANHEGVASSFSRLFHPLKNISENDQNLHKEIRSGFSQHGVSQEH